MNLHRILRRFDSCVSEVNELIAVAMRARHGDRRDFVTNTAYAVVKLHDIWATHCRQLIICSSSGGFSTLEGASLPRSTSLPKSVDEVEWLRQNWTARRRMDRHWEPDWHVPDQATRAAQLLGIANYVTVANALGAITIADQIRWTRNAIVHSYPVTYSRYRDLSDTLGFGRRIPLTDFVYNRLDGTGPMLFDHWVEQLRLCIASAIR